MITVESVTTRPSSTSTGTSDWPLMRSTGLGSRGSTSPTARRALWARASDTRSTFVEKECGTRGARASRDVRLQVEDYLELIDDCTFGDDVVHPVGNLADKHPRLRKP